MDGWLILFLYMCQQGLSTSTLASSFGKVITSKKKLTDYKPEDLASTLLSAFTYNIAQVSSFFFLSAYYQFRFLTLEWEYWKKEEIMLAISLTICILFMTPNILYWKKWFRYIHLLFLRKLWYNNISTSTETMDVCWLIFIVWKWIDRNLLLLCENGLTERSSNMY